MNNLRSLGSTLHVPESDRFGRFAIGSPDLAASGPTPPAAPSEPAASPPPFVGDGPALWAELHGRALDRQGRDDTAWLREFALKLPCGHCRVHWLAMVHQNPPVWESYFAWTVDRHNEVNRKLGRPDLSQLAAAARWMPAHRDRKAR